MELTIMKSIGEKLNNTIASTSVKIKNKHKELDELNDFNLVLNDVQKLVLRLEALHGDIDTAKNISFALDYVGTSVSQIASVGKCSRESKLLLFAIRSLLETILINLNKQN